MSLSFCIKFLHFKYILWLLYTLSLYLDFNKVAVVLILVGKPEGKRPLSRLRLRWEDNIKMDLQEVGCGGMDWIGQAQGKDR
jgi:hypothetical protein